MDAAVAAGRPPESAAFADDDWDRAQNDWLECWQPGERLPERSEPGGKRRKKWQSLTQTHGRHFDAAQARDTAQERDAPADDPQPDVPAVAEQAAPAATTAAAAPADRERLRSLRGRCLALGVEYSISDSIDELQDKVAEGEQQTDAEPPARAAAVPAPAREQPAPAPAAAPARAAGPEPAPAQTRCCDCCGQLAVPYVVALESCWLCRGAVCGACMPSLKHQRMDAGSRTVQACRSCAARGGPPAEHPKAPTGVVRRDDAPVFAADWFARDRYLYSVILCGYPWPPPMGGQYRFDMPEPGLYRITLEYPVLPPAFLSLSPMPLCTGATDEDADDEYWSVLALSAASEGRG